MKRVLALVFAALFGLAGAALAHGDYDHIQGTVTQISANAITVQTPKNETKTVTIANNTVFQKSGKAAKLVDLKVGDRVVIDVPKGKLEAHLIKFGPPPAKATTTAEHKHKG